MSVFEKDLSLCDMLDKLRDKCPKKPPRASVADWSRASESSRPRISAKIMMQYSIILVLHLLVKIDDLKVFVRMSERLAG